MTARPLQFLQLSLVALLLASCGKKEVVTITQIRELSPSERKPLLGATSQERFEFAMPGPSMGQGEPQQEAEAPHFDYETPAGWTVTPHPMREISFSFGQGGECSVIRAGGSLADNVNRWRKQMGLAEISADEAAALPKRTLLGFPAFTTTLDGSYQAMGAATATPNCRMIGVILPFQDHNASLFIKMVGPRDLVEQNETAFQAFCDSLTFVNS